MRKSLTFNGIRKSWLYLLEGRQKSPFPPVRNNLIRVPGMPGAHVGSKETDVLYITQPIGFIVKDDEHALQLKDELASWLLTNEAVPLEFDDEPGRTYYAEIEGTIEDFERFVDQRRGVITFLCSDPFSYGPEKEYEFESDTAIIENVGTAEADPIFELEVLEPVTFAMVSNGEEYNMIGRSIDDDTAPAERLTNIFEHDFGNFVGWTSLQNGFMWDDRLLGGIVGGSFGIGTNQWYVTDYGANTGGWHGPSMRTSLSESLQDFQVDHSLSSLSYSGQLGKNAIFLLDENDNIVASFGVVDRTVSKWNNHTVFTLGGEKQIFEFPGFNNANMWLRLIREGTQFTAMLYQIADDGTLYNKVTRYFDDRLGEFQQPIRQVAVYVARYQDYSVHPMYVNHLKVNRLNDLNENQVPIIADVGDIIKFDHKEDEIYINGEPRKDLKEDFGANYFKLHKGFNSLAVMPEGAFKTKLKYDPRFR